MNKQILVVIIMLLLTILYSCEKDNIEFDKSEYYLDKRDDKRYKIKQIGEEYWFLENLNYNNEGSTWYSNVEEYGDIYGRLYNWESAITACPPGWHLPTDEEWQKLEQYAGMTVQQSNSESWRGKDEGR
ncbi:MAG: hypothetical protein C0598_02540, partial [Marinilabiliales bacterium]